MTSLWRVPAVNPINNKAQSIPIFNPFNIYGQVFLLSWWSFFVASLSWYAFPPLLTVTIKKDLSLTQEQIANSNIVALTATLVVRLTAGAACDRFGPRWTFAAILVAGAIPTALVGTVQNAGGLIALRCFIGILGGSFVPCQVWTTGFFDKNVVGTANALAAGLGNAGSGVAYFLMPAIFDSLVQHQGLTPHTAWRVTFLAPFIMMAVSAVFIIVACPDTPTGKWSSRAYDLQRQNEHRDMYVSPFDSQNSISGPRKQGGKGRKRAYSDQTVELDKTSWNDSTTDQSRSRGAVFDEQDVLNAASWELVEKPTYHGYIEALFSPSTLTLVVAYFCTFGTELAVNAFLGAYYFQHFPSLGQTGSDQRAAMYGLLNAVFRPAGGLISDFLYRVTGSLWAKKLLMHTLVVAMGAVMVVVGFLDPRDKGMMVGLMAVLAFFEEAGNGAVFALLPHVQPTFNGLMTGVTAAAGDLGGIVFLLVARFLGVDYAKVFWVVGAVNIGLSLLVVWIRPVPRGQVHAL